MPDSLIDLINRRQLSAQQFATYLLKEYGLPSLDEAYKAARMILLDAGEITSRTKLNKIIVDVKKDVSPALSAALDGITKELSAFGIAEAAFAAETLSKFAPVNVKAPAKKKVAQYIDSAIMSLESGTQSTAGTFTDFVAKSKAKNIEAINGAITTGYSRGETTAQIIKRVKTSVDGVATNGLEALVRTGVQHYSQQANNAMRDDNLDVLTREMPITTWDSRRTLICTSVEAKYGANGSDGYGWPINKSPIGYPPYHFGCRTIVRPLPDGVELEGTRPAIAGKEGGEAEKSFKRRETKTVKDPATGEEITRTKSVKYSGRKDKAFEPEQISVNKRLDKFILEQPVWYQNKLLGAERAKLLRNGELDLSRLTDKQLKPLKLDELV